MRALVTGGAGFIGSHLVDRLLAAGVEVRILDLLDPQVHDGRPDYLSSDAELVEGDIRDGETVARCLRDVDRVVHLAAAVGVGQSMYEIERYTSVNAIGAAVLLERVLAVRDRVEKLVVASSMSIYGEGLYRCPVEEIEVSPRPRPESQLAARRWEVVCPSCGGDLEPLPTPETKPLQPTSVYAVGKRDHEELTLTIGRAYGIPSTALRLFNVYGTRQALSNPYTGVAAIFSSRLLNAKPPVIYEDGRQSRDFIHVSDVAAAVEAALEPGTGDDEALNVATGRSVGVGEIAATLARVLGVDLEPEIRNEYRAGDIRHCFGDPSRAREQLRWEAQVTLENGMRELGEWLATQTAVDRVDEATAALAERGLTGR
ncbi:MAG TPA: GDP-mannose 4,6-dehydratase [Gaiellaceae bacterium]